MQLPFKPSEVPQKPGVYVYRNRFGEVIYVGKASNLRRRMSSYFQSSRLRRADAKLRSLVNSIYDWSFETVRSEEEALILESRLIKDYAPYYNILMRDDKRYLLLKLDRSVKFPTLRLARVKKDDGAQYFGPFPNGGALKQTLEFLLGYFKLRSCRTDYPDEDERKRCMKRFVKTCSAPCVGAVSEAEYLAGLERALKVLEGNFGEVASAVRSRMSEAAAKQEFEQAAKWRDVLSNLQTVFGRNNRSFEHSELPGGAPGISGAESLREALCLNKVPHEIVGFDISHIGGTMTVASMVKIVDGRPCRQDYRRFRIRSVEGNNDFASMKEVLTRYFGRLLDEKAELPDMVMVDGGKGQLSSAVDALVAVGCPPLPVIGLAKKNEEIFVPGESEPVVLSRHDGALRMLQLLRDEAHRFAIGYNRKLRQRRLTESLLDDVPGVGEKRKMEILRAFGSVRALRRAQPEEICRRIPGLGEKLAERIFQKLNKKAN